MLGFLPGAQVKEKGALNAGLRKCFRDTNTIIVTHLAFIIVDQQAVLQWIQEHVSCARLLTYKAK